MEQAQHSIDASLNKAVRCGNGSLMRTTPIALVFSGDSDTGLDRFTADAGRITHPHQLCIESCQVYVRLIAAMLRSSNRQLEKRELFALLKDFDFTVEALQTVFGKYGKVEDIESFPEKDISSSGYVLHTLEAALWAFFSTSSFKEGAIKVVNLGDDADTVGAVYGGLAGAYYGVDAIPKDWVDGLIAHDLLDRVIRGTVDLALGRA